MWDRFETFVAVAAEGSFQAASRQGGASAVTLSRRIDALEADLGTVLFVRGASGLRLTSDGEALLRMVQPVAAVTARTIAEARRLKDRHGGRIRISGTEPVIAEVLAPRLGPLLADGDLDVALRVAAAPVDLSLPEAEIALRFARPQGDRLKVRRVANFSMSVWTSHDSGSATDRVVGYDETYGDIPERVWIREAGLSDRVTLETSSTRAILAIVRAGLAVGVLPDAIAGQDDALERVRGLPPVPSRPLWMMMHPDVARQAPVRRVAAWIMGAVREAEALGRTKKGRA